MIDTRSSFEVYAASLEAHLAVARPWPAEALAHTGTSSLERFARTVAAGEAFAKLCADARRCAALFDEANEPRPALLRRILEALGR